MQAAPEPTPSVPQPTLAAPAPTVGVPQPTMAPNEQRNPTPEAVLRPISEPRSKRGLLVGGLATVAVAALAAVGFVFLTSDSEQAEPVDRVELATDAADVADSDSAGFSYAAASANALTAASMSLDMTIESADGVQTIDVRFDRASGLVAMTADLSDLDPAESGFGIDAPVEMIIDEPAQTAYLSANILGALFGEDGFDGWLRLDASDLGVDSTGLDDFYTTPLSITDILGELEPVDLGEEIIAGEPLHRFQVTVDAETYATASGSNPGLFGEVPTGAIDVWVDADDQVRRMSFELADPASPDTASVLLEMEASPDAIEIAVPGPDELIDLDEIFGDFEADVDD